MNAAQAREIDLPVLLAGLGYQAQPATRQGIWYLSPFRDEKTPSFKVWQLSSGQWCWKDFGSGEGGNVIAFANRMIGKDTSDKGISDALAWLEKSGGGLAASRLKEATQHTKKPQETAFERGLVLVKEKRITHAALLAYAANRRIPEIVLHQYCREIYFKGKGEKRLFGIGFPNDSGGWEVRGAIGNFKAFVGDHKDITTLYGSDADPDTIHLFEGYFDCLSKEAFSPMAENEASMCLNSGSLTEKAIQKIQQEPRLRNVKFIRLWLQNDAIGKKTVHRFCEAFEQGYSVGDMSVNYDDCKDLNQSLMENASKWQSASVRKMYHDTAWNHVQNRKPSP